MSNKILYVDDELINLQLFEINFSDKYEVLIAESSSGVSNEFCHRIAIFSYMSLLMNEDNKFLNSSSYLFL